jgi:hypothetical protein
MGASGEHGVASEQGQSEMAREKETGLKLL